MRDVSDLRPRPRRLWHLAVRLLRGAGVQDRVRVGLQVLAVALVVAVGLLAATMPLAAGAGQARAASRHPRPAPDDQQGASASSRLTVAVTSDLHHGRAITRWQVGAGPDAPVPPGVDRLPAAGHLIASPRFLAALAADESLRRRYPGIVDGLVGPAGLVSPDELFVIVGVPDPVGEPTAGFGLPRALAGRSEHDSGTLVAGELVVLVVLPLLGFLVAASRMAIRVRMSRVSSLRLLGLSIRECAQLQGRQLALVAATGSILGCLLFQPLSATVGLSGVTGASWYPEDTLLPWEVLAALATVFTVVGRQFGRSSTRAALRGPAHSRVAGRWPSWVWWLAAVAASACLAVLGGVWLVLGPAEQWQQLPAQYAVILAWLVFGGLVLVMAVQLSARVSTRLLRSERITDPRLRLGARLARARPPGTTGSQVAVGLLIVVAGFSTVVTGVMSAASAGEGRPVSVVAEAAGLGGPEQRALVDLLRSGEFEGYAAVSGTYQGRKGGDDAGVDILVARCSEILGSGNDCGDGPVVLVAADDTTAPRAGRRVDIALVGTRTATLEVPNRTFSAAGLPISGVLLVPPGDAGWLDEVASVRIEFSVPASGTDYDQLLATLARDAPSVRVDAAVSDPAALEFFTQQRSLLQMFTAVGLLFCVLDLCLAGVSMSQDQRRSIAALQLLGIPGRMLRTALSFSKAFPAAVATGCIAIVTVLGGQALRAAAGLGAAPDPTLWVQATLATVLAVALTAALGALLAGRLDLGTPDSRE